MAATSVWGWGCIGVTGCGGTGCGVMPEGGGLVVEQEVPMIGGRCYPRMLLGRRGGEGLTLNRRE